MKITTIILLVVFVAVQGLRAQSAQQQWIDSASIALTTAPEDSNKVKLLLDLAYEVRYASRPEAITYAEEARTLSTLLEWQEGEASSSQFIGAMKIVAGDLPAAFDASTRALRIYQEIDNDLGAFKAMSDLGKAHAMNANFPEATRWYKSALELAEQMKDTGSLVFAYSNLASTYGMVANWPEALKTFQSGLALAEETGDRQGTLLPLANIAQIHNQIGNNQLSLDYYLRALSVAREYKLINYQASILANLIKNYSNDGDFDAAHGAYAEGMALARQMNDPRLIASFFNALRHLQQEEGDFSAARRTSDSVLVLASAIGNVRLLLQGHLNKGSLLNTMAAGFSGNESPNILLQEAASSFYEAEKIIVKGGYQKEKLHLYSGLRDLYIQQGSLDSVVKYYGLYVAAKDSIYTKEKEKEIANLEAVRESALKGKEVELLKVKEAAQQAHLQEARTVRNSILGIGVMIIALLGFFVLAQRRMSKLQLANKQLESEQLQFKLETKKKDLVDFALDNSKKREWTQRVLGRLDEIGQAQPQEQQRIIRSISVDLNSQLAADEELELFQQNVEQVNAEFYAALMGKHPSLTLSEKKLCGLIRLNMSGKEIANIRNVDPATITKSKQRLRKKLNLDPATDLNAFMQTV